MRSKMRGKGWNQMSKKHYQALARAIHERRTLAKGIQNEVSRLSHYTELTSTIADVLAADSPRFNRALFLEACETGKCKGMKG